MSDTPTEIIQPDKKSSEKQSTFKQPWFLALMAVLLVLIVAGVSIKTMNDSQNAKVAAIQLQQKQDKAQAAAAAAKVKHDAAAAKAKKDAAALAKAQKDAADAKKLAKQGQNTTPKIIVQQAPTYVAPPPTYVTPDYSGSGSYVAKVASMSTQSGAETYVSQIEAAGYPSDVFWSSNYSSMLPGYWVAAAGPFSTKSEAQSAADNLGGGAYVGYLG